MRTLLSMAGAVAALTTAVAAQADERFQWRGRVDGIDEILIRGDEIRVDHIEADPIQNQDYRFSSPLPRRDVHLKLTKRRGRGDVRIIEEPSGWNDYTARVRIDDGRQGGADDYEFELEWRSDDWDDWDNHDWDHDDEWDHMDHREEGVFRWAGRVDVGVRVEIRGGDHRIDDMGGSGTDERRARFTRDLPRDQVPVSLLKLEGRGDVKMVQAPLPSNDYTAVVEIKDDKGGADDYEFELSWRR